MRIYLLNPPYFPHFIRGARWQDTGRGGTLYYPIWLSYVTCVVEQEYKAKLVDAPAWNWDCKKVVDDVKKYRPDLIVMDSSFPSLNNDITVAKTIKEQYDCPTILIGPPASQFPEKILSSGSIDIVARFECDFTIKEIIDKINKGEGLGDIKGISFKKNGKIIHNPNREFTSSDELDKIPFVSKVYKKHLNIRDYFLGQSLYPEVQIFTGRGCPNLCTFCTWPQTLMGKKYRVRSISNVLDELEWIKDNLDVKEVFFEDDTFTINKTRVLEFCREYRKRGLNITWACNARVDTLDPVTMKEMKRSNCRLLVVGYESGSDMILRNIKKGFTVEQIKQFANNAKKAGLLVHGDFIIGSPGETKETIEQTKKLIKDIKPDLLQVSVASPFPGTEFYEWCKDSGYLNTEDPNEYLDDKGHQKAIISYPGLSNEEMVKEVDSMLKKYYISLSFVPLAMRQILRKHGVDELKRLFYSTKMFLQYVGERGK
ncbi:MAG: radical SAM protein [Methanosarcinales archaeon]|nr:radical SAM protein [Methanosarcinales archaeon]